MAWANLQEKDEHDAWLRDKTDEIRDKMWLEERERKRREKRRLGSHRGDAVFAPARYPRRWDPR